MNRPTPSTCRILVFIVGYLCCSAKKVASSSQQWRKTGGDSSPDGGPSQGRPRVALASNQEPTYYIGGGNGNAVWVIISGQRITAMKSRIAGAAYSWEKIKCDSRLFCGWEGNRRSVVALTICVAYFSVLSTYTGSVREMSTSPTLLVGYGRLFFTFLEKHSCLYSW